MNFDGHYINWTRRRINTIVAHYGSNFFNNKKILELGCGHADIGNVFYALGSDVTVSDGRQEHLNLVKDKYPYLKSIKANLESEWPFTEQYDVIIHMGILYHLQNPLLSLQKSLLHGRHVILESEILDSIENKIVYVKERDWFDQAMSLTGCRPSQKYIEDILIQHNAKFEILNTSSANSDFHVYDWQITNDQTYKDGQRRMWFIETNNVQL